MQLTIIIIPIYAIDKTDGKETTTMYVCLCKCITDTQIRRAIRNGACSMRELNTQLGVATECGKCGQHAREILRENRHEPQGKPLKSER